MSGTVLAWGLICVALLVVAFSGVRRLERALLYVPDIARIAPASVGLGSVVREVVMETPDGQSIVAWYAQAKTGQPTLIYFHGNGASLANRADIIARYANRGIGVFMMTYRGYGGSTGTPSEADNVRDAKQAYSYMRGQGVAAGDIVIFGESLGTGVAVQVAADEAIGREIAGVILDAPYTAIVDVATLHYPYLPARLLMKDRYETMKHIGKVTAPLLVVHGEADVVIPVEMGRKVAASSGGNADIRTFPGAGHTDHDQFGSFEAIIGWLSKTHGLGARSHLARDASMAG